MSSCPLKTIHRNDIFEKVISELDYEKFMSSYCGASCSMEGGRDVNSLRKIDFKRESLCY